MLKIDWIIKNYQRKIYSITEQIKIHYQINQLIFKYKKTKNK